MPMLPQPEKSALGRLQISRKGRMAAVSLASARSDYQVTRRKNVPEAAPDKGCSIGLKSETQVSQPEDTFTRAAKGIHPGNRL